MKVAKGLISIIAAISLCLGPQTITHAQTPAETVTDVQNVENTTHQDDFTAAQLQVMREAGVDVDALQQELRNMELTADQMEKRAQVLQDIIAKAKNPAAAETLIAPEGQRVEQALMSMMDELEVMVELGAELDAAITANDQDEIKALFPQFLTQTKKVHTHMQTMLQAVNDAIAKLQAANLK